MATYSIEQDAASGLYRLTPAKSDGGLGGLLGNFDQLSGFLPSARPWRPIAYRNWDSASLTSTLSAGVVQSATSKVRKVILRDATALKLVYDNYYLSTGNQPGTNAIVVKAAIEDAAGHVWPVFFNGSRTVTIQPGGVVESDPASLTVAAGTSVYVRTFVDASGTSPYKYPFNYTLYGANITFPSGAANGENGIDSTDYCDSGTITGSAINLYSASLLLGQSPSADRRSVACIGDSITAGGWGHYTDDNFLLRALSAAGIPSMTLAEGSAPLEHWETDAYTRSQYRRQLLHHFSTVIIALGINNLGQGASTIIGRMQNLATELKRQGKRVYFCTFMPKVNNLRTQATGFGTTIAGQIAAGRYNETDRVAVNTSIRDYLGGSVGQYIDGVIDLCQIVEVNADNELELDGGYWKVPAAPVYSGTAGSQTSQTGIDYTSGDFPAGWTADCFKSMVCKITSGTGAGKLAGIVYVDSWQFYKLAFPSSEYITGLAPGDTFEIWPVYSIDGVHTCAQSTEDIATGIAAQIAAIEQEQETMALDEALGMTLDQLLLGGPYPDAADVLHDVATGDVDGEGNPILGTLPENSIPHATLGLGL